MSILKAWSRKIYNWLPISRNQPKPAKEVFERIFENKKWSGKSYSGPGSDLKQTDLVRRELEKIIIDYRIKSLLDVPCGDWFWMQHTNLDGVNYTGGDIVARIIENNQQFANDHISFQFLDLLESQLPAHDLVFCRDCLVHFSYSDIGKALNNLTQSDCRYLLTTTFPGRKNYDIRTGSWRPIDLEASPFNLPKPIKLINEGCTQGNGKFRDKSLALWDLNQLEKAAVCVVLKDPS